MLDEKTRVAMTRQELVSHLLRVLALRADPANGYLTSLAAVIRVHPTTLSDWIAQGYVPWFQVRKLAEHFGEENVDSDGLCPSGNRY